VLVEGRSKSGAFTGRTERNEIVHFDSVGDPTAELVELRVARALRHSLVGEMLDPTRWVKATRATWGADAGAVGTGTGHAGDAATKREPYAHTEHGREHADGSEMGGARPRSLPMVQ
jgi:hypothetical protein